MFDALNHFLTIFVLVAPVTYFLLILFRFKKGLLESKYFILLLIIFPIILLYKLLFFNQTLSAHDFNNIQIPFFESLRNSLQKNSLVPIWNTNFGAGFDVFSNPLAYYFSSFSFLLYFFKNTYLATNTYLLLQIIFLGIFSFLFLRELSFNKIASFIGSLILTFNGFVIMRLSPGVGVEYLFAYKWLPLILLFSYSVFFKKNRTDLIFLAISLAFSFEGNLNISISIGIMWVFFLFFISNLKNIEFYKDLFKTGFLAFAIYAVKLIPGVDLMLNTQGRISSVVSGWRATRVVINKLAWYFLPTKDSYVAGPFTPGILGFLIFIFGLTLFIYFVYKRKKFANFYWFGLSSLILGLILCSTNLLSDFIFGLPFFNRLTINPSFYIFILIPIGLFGAFFVSHVFEKYNKYSRYLDLTFLAIGFLIFLEILKGPATLGKSSYSFNFNKMNYSEPQSYLLYQEIKNKTNGNFVFVDANKIFNLPGSIQSENFNNLNRSEYFYGASYFKELPDNEKISNYKIHTDYLISTKDINDNDLELISKISMQNYLKKVENIAILINKDSYELFVKNEKWDQFLRIYKVSDNFSKKAVILNSNHPYKFSFLLNEKNIENNDGLTSISYSRHWQIKNQAGKMVSFEKDSNGLMILKNVKPYETIFLTYINNYIYIGFLISLLAFFYTLHFFLKYYLKLVSKNN